MLEEEIAFQLLRLYRTLRGPAADEVKEAARREIDLLLRQIEAKRGRPVPGEAWSERPRPPS